MCLFLERMFWLVLVLYLKKKRQRHFLFHFDSNNQMEASVLHRLLNTQPAHTAKLIQQHMEMYPTNLHSKSYLPQPLLRHPVMKHTLVGCSSYIEIVPTKFRLHTFFFEMYMMKEIDMRQCSFHVLSFVIEESHKKHHLLRVLD